MWYVCEMIVMFEIWMLFDSDFLFAGEKFSLTYIHGFKKTKAPPPTALNHGYTPL